MDCFYPTVLAIPKFLRQTKYRNPTDIHHIPFQLGAHTACTFFEALADNPVLSAQFNNHMSIYHKGRTSWMDPGFYPVDQLQGDSPIGEDDVLLVDVGGGKGHDLNEFRTKWPTMPGRLILQDLPAVLAEATDLHPVIECMAHDFFTEQPIKGLSFPSPITSSPLVTANGMQEPALTTFTPSSTTGRMKPVTGFSPHSKQP